MRPHHLGPHKPQIGWRQPQAIWCAGGGEESGEGLAAGGLNTSQATEQLMHVYR